jgi:cysteinyl-tRNA synthetase, unknown class
MLIMPHRFQQLLTILPRVSRATWQQIAGLFALVLVLFFVWIWRDLPANWYEATQTTNRPFSRVGSWHYQLQNVDIDRLVGIEADVMVVDFARNGVPLTREDVARLKVQPNGRPRVVLSYLSVGEAEEKRFYWNPTWTTQPESRPSWLVMPNCAWPGAWAIRFWQDGWKQILFRGETSYLRKIIQAGFDGVYLDRVDMFEDFPEIAKENRDSAQDMIDLVVDLGQTARRIKPKFLVVPNNGISLLTHRDFRRAIDGLGMEELLFSEKGTGVRNSPDKIQNSLSLLRKLQWDYKPVFTLEYLRTRDAIASAKTELAGLGIIAGFPTRALDGGDPTAPVELKTDPGTPEFIAANCNKANSW